MITPKPREFKFVIKKAPDGFNVIWDMSYSFELGNFHVIEYCAYETACKERDELLNWKQQMDAVVKPAFEFEHPEMKLGDCRISTLIRFAKERDDFAKEGSKQIYINVQLAKERDQARADDAKTQAALEHVLKLNTDLIMERDEARAALTSQDKAYADSKCELLEARAEVDKLKEKQKWMGENSLTATLQELLAETAVALEKISRCQMVAYKNQAIESKARNVVAVANDMLTKLKSHMAGEE